MRQSVRLSRALLVFLVLATGCTFLSLEAVEARKVKANLNDPRLDSRNFFADPGESGGQTPTFVSVSSGLPLSSSRILRSPDFTAVRQLPSLSEKQRQEINRLERQLVRQQDMFKNATIALTARTALKDRLNQSRDQVVQSNLKEQIAQLANGADEARQGAFSDLQTILSDNQRQEYERMRHGDLVMEPRQLPDGSESSGK
jgi:hypothetical protein